MFFWFVCSLLTGFFFFLNAFEKKNVGIPALKSSIKDQVALLSGTS